MPKTDLDSYRTEALQHFEFGNEARVICSQKHLPPVFVRVSTYQLFEKKIQELFFDSCVSKVLSDYVFYDVAWTICSR